MIKRKSTGLAVSVNKASFSYNNIKAVDELTLQVPSGISFGLLGPNGAGKTTLIRLLVGLLKPKSGSVQISGQTPSRKTAHLTGYMPQLHSLYAELSVIQNVDCLARIDGLRGFRKSVVVKRILPHLAEVESFVTMFLREARLAAAQAVIRGKK